MDDFLALQRRIVLLRVLIILGSVSFLICTTFMYLRFGFPGLVVAIVISIVSGFFPGPGCLKLIRVIVEYLVNERRLDHPPSYGISAVKWIVGRKYYERVVEQHLNDANDDWMDAHAEGKLFVAKWVKFRTWLVVLFSIIRLPIESGCLAIAKAMLAGK